MKNELELDDEELLLEHELELELLEQELDEQLLDEQDEELELELDDEQVTDTEYVTAGDCDSLVYAHIEPYRLSISSSRTVSDVSVTEPTEYESV